MGAQLWALGGFVTYNLAREKGGWFAPLRHLGIAIAALQAVQ